MDKDKFIYAISSHEDGTLTLTVFEENNSASVELPIPWVKRLIEHLTDHIKNHAL